MVELLAIVLVVLVGSAVYITRRRACSGASGNPTDAAAKPVKGSLGVYSAGQWKRILPEKPGQTVWIGPKRPGPVEPSILAEISVDIDRALDVFYSGGKPEEVEKHLLRGGLKIKTDEYVGDIYVAYDKDQRPFFIGLINEIRDILRIVADQNRDDQRFKVLAAREEDIREIRVLNEANEDDRIARIGGAFEEDPRTFDVSWNTGYHYTTGESSGNAETLKEEGAIEVGNFSAKCLAEDYPDILSKFNDIYIAPEDRVTTRLQMSGGHFGDGSVGSFLGIKSRLREDVRAFNIDLSTSRYYDGPEGTDDNHTNPEDIHEAHYLQFSCHKIHAESLAREMGEIVQNNGLSVTITVDP